MTQDFYYINKTHKLTTFTELERSDHLHQRDDLTTIQTRSNGFTLQRKNPRSPMTPETSKGR
ncbi:hypothetical protein HanIR_Chr16g0818641 [Helianthus annuus]|nr:hypothetical protein HanIR_Chr16g0818641 [Helianthus annuus]